MTIATRRPVPEWIGKKPTSKPPQSVYLRLWDKQEGRCAISDEKMFPKDEKHVDHIIPLRDGGENRESNLQIVLAVHHKEKTREENSQRAKDDRIKADYLRLKKPSRNPLPGGKNDKLKRKIGGRTVLRSEDT